MSWHKLGCYIHFRNRILCYKVASNRWNSNCALEMYVPVFWKNFALAGNLFTVQSNPITFLPSLAKTEGNHSSENKQPQINLSKSENYFLSFFPQASSFRFEFEYNGKGGSFLIDHNLQGFHAGLRYQFLWSWYFWYCWRITMKYQNHQWILLFGFRLGIGGM